MLGSTLILLGARGARGRQGHMDRDAAGRGSYRGPEGCFGPGAQEAVQAGVADPAGPGLLPQVLGLVDCVLPLLPASRQRLNQADV